MLAKYAPKIGLLAMVSALIAIGPLITLLVLSLEAAPVVQVPSLQELRDEIDNDPKALGYSGLTNFQIANLLNAVGLSGETVDVAVVSSAALQAEVIGSEYLTLNAGQRDLWAALLMGTDSIEVRDTEIRGQVLLIWDAATTTRANLATLQTRSASRAEALWGDGTFITTTMVDEALLLP